MPPKKGVKQGPRKSLEEKFYSKTIVGATPLGLDTPCLIWKGKQAKHGYGLFCYSDFTTGKPKESLAHRFHYTWKVGEIAPDFYVMHKCDIRNCVSLEHLVLGTAKENAQDRENKKRTTSSAPRNQCSLTVSDVAEIRRLGSEGSTLKAKLARDFGVHRTTIINILAQKTHVIEPDLFPPSLLGSLLTQGTLSMECHTLYAQTYEEARTKTAFPVSKHFFGNFLDPKEKTYPAIIFCTDIYLNGELVMRKNVPFPVSRLPK